MTKLLTPETEKSLSLPVGVVSPLWLMFGAAALTGAAVFWARNWLRPTNVEAGLNPQPLPPAPEAVVEVVDATFEPIESVVEARAEPGEGAIDAVEAAADDLTRLTGIGPKLAASLAARGVTRFADIAAWTAEDVEALDKDLRLMGRIGREGWIAQAKRLSEAAVH